MKMIRVKGKYTLGNCLATAFAELFDVPKVKQLARQTGESQRHKPKKPKRT